MLDKIRKVSTPLVVGSLGSAALAGLVTGLMLTVLQPSTGAGSAFPATPVTTVGGAQGGGSLNTAAPALSEWGPSPASTGYAAEPWDTSGLELSRVTDISVGQDGPVRLTVDRLTYLTGAKAADYWAERADRTPRPFAVVNQNPRLYTFQLASSAPIYLGADLGGGSSATPTRSAAPALVSGVRAALARGEQVYVWLRHDETDGGWATYVAEHTGDRADP